MASDPGIDGIRILGRVVGILTAWTQGGSVDATGDVREFVNKAVLDTFAALVYEDIMEAFASESNPVTGESWAPIQRPGKILYLTGELYRLALASVSVGRRNADVGQGHMALQMIEPSYWWRHQFGDAPIKARPFYGASESTIDMTGQKFTSALAQAIVSGQNK